MCQGLDSHYFHIIGDKLINPIVRGLYTHYHDSLLKVGWVYPQYKGVDRPWQHLGTQEHPLLPPSVSPFETPRSSGPAWLRPLRAVVVPLLGGCHPNKETHRIPCHIYPLQLSPLKRRDVQNILVCVSISRFYPFDPFPLPSNRCLFVLTKVELAKIR